MSKTNEIAVIKNLCPALSVEERELLICGQGLKIKELTKKNIKISLAEIIPRVVFDAGQQMDELKLVGTIESILPDLKYYTTLTLADIEKAFKLGVRGEYGEYMGINPVSLLGFLRGYISSAKRAEAKRKQQKYIDELNNPPPPTPEEINKIMVGGCIKAYEIVKSGAFYDDLGNATYGYLDRLKLIPFSKQRKLLIMEKAKESVKNKLLGSITGNESPTFKAEVMSKLKTLKANDPGSEKLTDVIIEAKKIAINEYIKDLIELGETFEDVLNS